MDAGRQKDLVAGDVDPVLPHDDIITIVAAAATPLDAKVGQAASAFDEADARRPAQRVNHFGRRDRPLHPDEDRGEVAAIDRGVGGDGADVELGPEGADVEPVMGFARRCNECVRASLGGFVGIGGGACQACTDRRDGSGPLEASAEPGEPGGVAADDAHG